ncbi:Super oxide dismutase [Lonomia obliqua multiple nucleopolyhedrovirus]|uniref:superoxide dismutase n=1 Tax=Lonomia obliqua multiple nucleopolyhedrovirus TaxID=134394 RepID=A0A126FCD0_9ABAC|nr:Super oxide dismutase [Lonomia obliqua multiple nucleopolyhedrovirus]AKN81005.1 Super oxide dismutase [Lonomia obliqua multiple nucleopolyhedrovirus]
MKAVCIIDGSVYGQVQFYQDCPGDFVKITGYLLNLPKGLHGFHIHEYGDTSNGCTSAGEHFNPTLNDHGAPEALVRHVGDLGNIRSAGVTALTEIAMSDNVISLFGPNSILGRSLVVHTDQDDLGLTDHPLSKTTGNSGGRLGCGIIGAVNDNHEIN